MTFCFKNRSCSFCLNSNMHISNEWSSKHYLLPLHVHATCNFLLNETQWQVGARHTSLRMGLPPQVICSSYTTIFKLYDVCLSAAEEDTYHVLRLHTCENVTSVITTVIKFLRNRMRVIWRLPFRHRRRRISCSVTSENVTTVTTLFRIVRHA